MRFNVEKCHVLHLGCNNPHFRYTLGSIQLTRVEEEKDISGLITSILKPGRHCEKAARTANGVLSQILRSFSYRDREVLPKIYRTYVRLHLEYSSPAWSPWQRGEIQTLKKVQQRFIGAIGGLTGTYEEKLAQVGLETLESRRLKLDLAQTYKIIHGIDKVCKEEWFSLVPRQQNTRLATDGLCLARQRARNETRTNFFSQRVVGAWNALPPDIRHARSVASFKFQLKRLAILPG